MGGTETELSNDTFNKSEEIRTDTKKEGVLETTTNISEIDTEENFSITLVSGEISLIGGVSFEVKIGSVKLSVSKYIFRVVLGFLKSQNHSAI